MPARLVYTIEGMRKMAYVLPFKPTDSVAELGGGTQPLFHPNIDTRPDKGVDLITDLNQGIPLPDESYDGIFSSYLIEHLSWRRVKPFIVELHRVLKPNGVAVMITANLFQQAKRLVETPEWNDQLICMIFGDNDYPENTHRCGFSPSYAIKLFREAGFHEVTIFEHPNCKTDLIIEAHKSGARITRSL